MSIARSLLRTVVPPVLAAGLALLLVHPLDAVASAAPEPSASDRAVAAMLADHAPGAAGTAAGVSTTVPVVAFQRQAVAAHGRLRTAVLVNVSAVPGTATVLGITGCTTELAPGVPAWLDCADHGERTLAVRVVLSDGHTFTDTALPVVR